MNFINKVMDLAKVDKLNKEQLKLINEYLDNKSISADRAKKLIIFMLLINGIALGLDSDLISSILCVSVICLLGYILLLYIKIYKSKNQLVRAIKKIPESID